MLPGFKSRLVAELRDLAGREKYRSQLCVGEFKFHEIPAKENYVSWLGGEFRGSCATESRRVGVLPYLV